MKIEETLVTKSLNKISKDPYRDSLDLMKRMSERGKVVERKNSYSTDGPFHRSDVAFDVVSQLDSYSNVRVSFFLTGENGTRNFLRADILASFNAKIKETGFFSEIFAEFYMENVFPLMRKAAEGKTKRIVAMSEKMIAAC